MLVDMFSGTPKLFAAYPFIRSEVRRLGLRFSLPQKPPARRSSAQLRWGPLVATGGVQPSPGVWWIQGLQLELDLS